MSEPTPEFDHPGSDLPPEGQAVAEARSGQIDLATVRERLAGREGPAFWRSLEELAGSEEFETFLHREFPRFASEWPQGVDRRRFLQLMGASVALGGLTACTRQPLEHIVPYVQQPEGMVPGKAQYFATSIELAGSAVGLLAESHEGRPTKVEGNPDHPSSLGGSDLYAQASVLQLYDPDRSQVVRHNGRISTWAEFHDVWAAALAEAEADGGAGLVLLTESTSSPTFASQVERLRGRFPRARWVTWDAISRDHERAGLDAALGEPRTPLYDFGQADVVLTLDSDVLNDGPGSVRYGRDFARRRRPEQAPAGRPAMSRLYSIESTPTGTGTLADHRLSVSPRRVAALALEIARRVGVAGLPAVALEDQRLRNWAAEAAADLQRHRGRCLVVAGETVAPEVHTLVAAMNLALGAQGRTVRYLPRTDAASARQTEDLAAVTADLRAGRVQMLAILGGNPLFDAPADLDFAAAMAAVPLRLHLALYEDETSEFCHWHLPQSHYLEAWGDGRAHDGTATLVQPLIEPLYDSRSAIEVLSFLAGGPDAEAGAGRDLVEARWAGDIAAGGGSWRRALHDGFLTGTGAAAAAAALDEAAVAAAGRALAARLAAPAGLELSFRSDPTLWDGRFANLGWLQECPKPVSKLAWDNPLFVSPATARRLGIETEQVVRVSAGERSLELPVWVLPGQADDHLSIHLGGGRRRAGRVGNGVGFDVYPLRTTDHLWSMPDVRVEATGRRHPLVSTHLHHDLELAGKEAEARHILRVADLPELERHPELVHHMGHEPGEDMTLYRNEDHPYEGHAWAMAIDLNACSGCNACVVACQAENNIPVVGKDQVAMGREMHWIRIDRYFQGSMDDPRIHSQPVTCMHCENAPCEVVCPVAATVHSDEGLNDMVYNRCVGTRYCANNCPYKVRRFNFFLYSDYETPVLKLMRNPDVTVRSRGVMEKCSYCVQRIEEGKIEARVAGRELADGDIVTACQQACPSEAIAFGDKNDPHSKVSRWRESHRHYAMLADLNTRPRTTYLAKVRNPNPALEGA